MQIPDDYYFEYLEELCQRDYKRLLMRAPHCLDPEHPGCEDCEEQE